MERGETAAGKQGAPATNQRSYLFTVRLWKEDVANGVEYRGKVRDVAGGVFHHFRHWSDLVSFLCARVDEDERTRTDWPEDEA